MVCVTCLFFCTAVRFPLIVAKIGLHKFQDTDGLLERKVKMAGRSELDDLLDLVGAGDDIIFHDEKKEKKKSHKKESTANIAAAVTHAVHTKHLVEKAVAHRFDYTEFTYALFANLFMLACIFIFCAISFV